MQEHWVVVNPFVDAFGDVHWTGEQIIPGDTATPSMLIEISRQTKAGNLVRVPGGEGVANPNSGIPPEEAEGD